MDSVAILQQAVQIFEGLGLHGALQAFVIIAVAVSLLRWLFDR